MTSVNVTTQRDLPHRWTQLAGKKNTLLSNCEDYAAHTLPYVFPRENTQNMELQLAKDSIGSQAVNHLSNKVVSILFPAQRMFFRLLLDQATREKAEAALSAAGAKDVEAAKAEVAKAMTQVEELMANTEKKVQDYMDLVTYRPQAVNTAKLLIITGNALMYHPDKRPVQVYNLRDYSLVRDLSGEVIEIMTREMKAFETFKPDVQEKLRIWKAANKYNDDTNVTIYTQIKLEDDGKYHVYQSADDIKLDTKGAFFTKDKLPWIPLTWNLVRGEDYGRGLVAEYMGAFHAVNVLSGSLLNIAAIMGDIKFLVNPTSLVDIPTLNQSASGTYHPGKKDDVTAIQMDKQADAQFIAGMIDRYEKQIAQAFLLNSAITRDAERVTAEEIRMQANELETANGGIYSRLAATWQVQTANVLLDQINFKGLGEGFVPKIITGMDSLSRAGELDNIRMFFGDLAMLQSLPEPVLQSLDMPGLYKVLGTNRQVDYQQFTLSAAQLAEKAAQVAQQAQAMQQNETNGQAQVAASKEAMKG